MHVQWACRKTKSLLYTLGQLLGFIHSFTYNELVGNKFYLSCNRSTDKTYTPVSHAMGLPATRALHALAPKCKLINMHELINKSTNNYVTLLPLENGTNLNTKGWICKNGKYYVHVLMRISKTSSYQFGNTLPSRNGQFWCIKRMSVSLLFT